MFRTLVKSPVFNNALRSTRSFSVSSARNALSIKLNGSAEGYRQTLKVDDPVNVNHVIDTDAFKELGGTDLHPDPIQYLYSSISGCQQITASLVARDRGIKLGKAKIDIDASLIPVSKTPNEYPGFLTEKVIINYKVETDATDEQFEQLREETESKCPIAQVFINSKGLKFESNWSKVPLTESN